MAFDKEQIIVKNCSASLSVQNHYNQTITMFVLKSHIQDIHIS